MKIITICGSLKFQNEMMITAEKLTLEGNYASLSNITKYRKNRRTIRKAKRITF